MSLLKYFGEPGGDSTPHSAPLLWPGTSAGFPVRGGPPRNHREGDPEPYHVGEYHAERFRLWMDDDHQRFTWIMDRVFNGWFKILKRDDFWDANQEAFLVWLEWLQIYGEYPDKTSRGSGNGQAVDPNPPRNGIRRPIDSIPIIEDEFPDGNVV